MGIILPLLSFFLFVFFLAFIANAITKLLFPRQKGTALEYLFTGILFSVEVVVITLALYAFSEVKNEAAEGVAWMYVLLGMPTSFIGMFLLSFLNQVTLLQRLFLWRVCLSTAASSGF